MGERYVQFLGSKPGTVVELLDDSSSPYRVRTSGGFEFSISADDFRNYYKKEGTPTPAKWNHMLTDPDDELVDSRKMAVVVNAIKPFEAAFQDFVKARAVVRDALILIGDDLKPDIAKLRSKLQATGLDTTAVRDADLARLAGLARDIRELLNSDSCAVVRLPTGSAYNGEIGETATPKARPAESAGHRAATRAKAVKPRRSDIKNGEMTLDGNILRITVDLSKEVGPSKSGKTVILATSEGNKSIPGRDEKIGLNIYRQEAKKAARGRKSSFKNVEMAVNGDTLTVEVDLSKEFGPSKSGKTIIVASTGGNQLIVGREEKIGLNVYKKIE